MEITIKQKPISKENFSKFGDMITTDNLKPIEREVIQNWRRTGKSSSFIIKKLITQETDDLEKYLKELAMVEIT